MKLKTLNFYSDSKISFQLKFTPTIISHYTIEYIFNGVYYFCYISTDDSTGSTTVPPSSRGVVQVSSSVKSVKVHFLFKPLTNLSFRTITLISSFSVSL